MHMNLELCSERSSGKHSSSLPKLVQENATASKVEHLSVQFRTSHIFTSWAVSLISKQFYTVGEESRAVVVLRPFGGNGSGGWWSEKASQKRKT